MELIVCSDERRAMGWGNMGSISLLRIMAILLSLIPAVNGLLVFFNNVVVWRDEVDRITIPLLSMSGVNKASPHLWRAIESEWVAVLCHFFVLGLSLIVGVVALLGVIKMIKALVFEGVVFLEGVMLVKYACLIGVCLWGFIFTVVAGSWFVSWQNPALSFLHFDGVLYSALVLFVYIGLDSLAKDV